MAKKPTQDFIPISQIRDGIVLLKDGSMKGILMVSPINLGLKSVEEQEATIYQFQNFLNILDFSIQIVAQSRVMDLRPYVQSLEERIPLQEEELLRVQTKQYVKYIKSLSTEVDIMKKYFYIVVPYSGFSLGSSGGKKKGILSRFQSKKKQKEQMEAADERFEERRTQLVQRMGVVQSGLSATGVTVTPLNTQQTIEVFYSLYNPGDSQGSIIHSFGSGELG